MTRKSLTPRLSRLPTVINTMAILMGGGEPSEAVVAGGCALPSALVAEVNKLFAEATRRDAGLRVLCDWAGGLPDTAVRDRARRWLMASKTSPVFRRSVEMGACLRGVRCGEEESAFALALVEAFAAVCHVPGQGRADGAGPDGRTLRGLLDHHGPDTSQGARSIGSVLRRLVDWAVGHFRFREGSLLLYDESRNDLRFYLSVSPVAGKLAGLRVPIEGSIAGTLLRTGHPAYVADVLHSGQHYGEVDRATGVRTESILGAPLVARDRPIGVIEMVNRRTRKPCSQRDLEDLTALAGVIARIVEGLRRRDDILTCFLQSIAAVAGRQGGGMSRRRRISADARWALRAAMAIGEISRSGVAASACGRVLRRLQGLGRGWRLLGVRPYDA